MMNPLVEQMLVAQHRNDLEREILESLFEDEVRCQGRHTYLPCSVKVVGVITATCSGTSSMKCQTGVEFSEREMSRNAKCVRCKNPCSECWTIRPI